MKTMRSIAVWAGMSLVGWCVAATMADTPAPPNDLPRRIALGVHVRPVDDGTKTRLKLRAARGVEIIKVMPGTMAEATGLKEGDVLTAIDEKGLVGVQQFVDLVAAMRAGNAVTLMVARLDGEKKLTAETKELPRESAPDLDIEYGHVVSTAGRQRMVTTLPKPDKDMPSKPLKGIVLLSGLGNGPAEHPSADPLGAKALAYALAREGFAVARIDKPGCGDSEGGPSHDVDFDSIVDGYVQGVERLKSNPKVDPNQIHLLGVSIGGVQAPLVAAATSVRGVAVYGAMSCDWQTYIVDTTSRQLRLAGVGPGEIDATVRLHKAGWHYLIHEKLTPDEIAERRPELTEWVEGTWPDGKSFSGVNYRFFQQLGAHNPAAAWSKFDGRVLSLWGEHDFVTARVDHERLAEIANQRKAGAGVFHVVEGLDHNLLPTGATKPPFVPSPEPVAKAVAEWLR